MWQQIFQQKFWSCANVASMTFEVDLIKYVINLAIVRGLITKSKDLNSDWLPFATVLDVFDEVCVKLGVSKVVEEKCYRTILKMCSAEEKHLTWAYKVDNIAKYFPLRTSTHAEKHTSCSWNRHKSASAMNRTTLELPSYRRPYSSSKKRHSIDAYADFGLNMGTIRALQGSKLGAPPHYSPPQNSFVEPPYYPHPGRVTFPLNYAYDRDDPNKSPLYGFSLLAASPTLPPAPPSLFERSPYNSPTPPGKVSFNHSTPYSHSTPPAVPYYRDYIPSSRISPIARTNSPYALSSALKSVSKSTREDASQTMDLPHPTLLMHSLEEGEFGEEELLAMKERVAGIEREAKKTRQLLSHIAYLKNRSPSSSRGNSPKNSSGSAGMEHEPLHHRHVEYGEIALSPYLKEVLHLPPAVVLTDTYDTNDSAAVGSPLPTSNRKVSSPDYGHTPVVHGYTAEVREERTSPTYQRPTSSSTDKRRPSSANRNSRSTERESSGGRSRSHSREDPHQRYVHAPTSPVSPTSQMHKSFGRSSNSSSRTPSHSKHTYRYEQEQQRTPRGASPGRTTDFSSTLNQSPAMRKYTDFLHTTGRSPNTGGSATSSRSRSASRSASRSPSPERAHSRTLQELSGRLARSAEKAAVAANTAARYSMYQSNERSPVDTSVQSRSSHRSRSPPQFRTAQKDALLHLLHSHDPSSAGPYHNTCRTQHTDELSMTTIDSSIDDLLGDSLNIEEKDGRVYVNFQSRFVL